MSKAMWIGLVSAWGALVAQAGETRTFEHRYEGYPSTGANCHEVAKSFAESYRVIAGLQNVIGRCVNEERLGFNFTVSYQAEERVKQVSTVADLGSLDQHTPFKTLADCQAALPEEVRVFEAETKIKSSFAFCSGDRVWDKDGWRSWIEGFGTTERAPRVSEFLYFTVPTKITGKELAALIKSGLAAAGATSRHVTFKSNGTHGTASVSYYFESKVRIDAAEPTRNRTAEECEAELADLKSFQGRLTPAPVASYCGKDVMSGMEITIITFGEPSYQVSLSVEKFDDYAKCAAAKPGLIQYYQTDLGRPVYGGLCTGAMEDGNPRGYYKVQLFEKK